MIKKKSIEDIDPCGKSILIRVDFNVPLEGNKVRDDSRIKAALPTIERLINVGARLTLVSHLGRPKGTSVESLKMDPVANRLSELLEKQVLKIDHITGPEVGEKVQAMKDGDLLMLENVRFAPEEEKNDPGFARELARPFDCFVNDAFGTAHRAHASTVGVTAYIPAVAGLLMKREIEELSRCIDEPQRPLTAILGGAKVSDKINVIRRFLELADNLLVGGGMANTFLVAAGYELGSSFFEKEQVDTAVALIEQARESRCRLLLPDDLVAVEELKTGSPHRILKPGEITGDWKAVDIGPETASRYRTVIRDSAMVVWNGPMGVFEIPPFDRGTGDVASGIAESSAYSVVGGGDLVAAIEMLKLSDKISFISTGGGATLEFWEGKELPGIAALQDR